MYLIILDSVIESCIVSALREILQCSRKTRAIHLNRSDGYKMRRANREELKLWVGTYTKWARNQFQILI